MPRDTETKLPGRSLVRRIAIVGSFLLFLAIISLHSCITMRSSQEDLDALLAEVDPRGAFRLIEEDNRTIAWIEAGKREGPLIVFVHGSPGSLDDFSGFFRKTDLLTRARLVSVDRPGFGYSELGSPEPSLARQAAVVARVIAEYPDNNPTILVGHSYGAPVIARVAIDHPRLVDALVLVAPSIDPDLEPHQWFQRPLASPALRWLVPRPLRASNEEILALESELRAMVPMWSEIRVPVTVIQGGRDRLVPPENADFADRVLVNAEVEIVRIDEMNHFVPWSDPHLILDAIDGHLDRLTEDTSARVARP